MPGDAYLKLGASGAATEQRSIQTSAGAGDAGKIPALDTAGRMASNMMPLGIVPETVSFVAFEDLTAGNNVNLFLSSGVLKGRKADNSNARQAHCFVNAAVATAATGVGYTEGVNSDLSGMTIGVEQMLGTSGGRTESVPSAGATTIVQHLGIAKSATELIFDPKQPIERAA